MTFDFNLTGKTFLVTGAARRLGRKIALALAEKGADLVIHFNHSEQEAKATLSSVLEKGSNGWLIKSDLRDSAAIISLFEKANGYANLSGLINNASIFKSQGLHSASIADWQEHLDVNLTAPFLLTQFFANSYKDDAVGRIINLIDWRAFKPGYDHFSYTISKAGLEALTRASAVSLAPRIIVNSIALGAILPPENETAKEDILLKVPLRRWADLNELAQTILFLVAGPESITGETIFLDGGRHLL